uniref:GPI mannosyltransferase 1 n=1 Tax=Panagrolaimus sp. ES5 TaxID=591445 RepID=A0AC34FRY0_9BILA
MSETPKIIDRKEILRNQKADELKILCAAFSLRLAFIFYAQIHDYYFHVNFTDIDYKVFSDAAIHRDAAIHVANGRSPFDRPTYRYTPFLAWLLVPVLQFPNFGKILFCAADIVVGWLLIRLRRRQNFKYADPSGNIPSQHDHVFDVYALWLFNPFTMVISARGNADSLVCLAVLSTLYFLRQDKWILAALIHGLAAIHLRIYPIIFLPSIFLHFINIHTVNGSQDFIKRCLKNIKGFVYIFITTRKSLQLLAGWFIGQGIWLGFAYLFEFRGLNTLVFVWLASLIFVSINFWILISLIRRYQPIHLLNTKEKLKKLK